MPPTLDSLTLLFTPSEMDEERKRERNTVGTLHTEIYEAEASDSGKYI